MAKTPDGLDLGILPEARGAWEKLCKLQDDNPVYPCAQNPELYMDTDFLTEDEAEEVCYGCPLLKVCYDFAVANSEQFGIWGGVNFSISPDELF
jgi:hypothetical protein